MYKRSILSASIILALTPTVHAKEYALLDEVVVSATRTEQNKTDVSASVESVSSQDMEKRLSNDLKDAVQYTPGVQATTSGRFGLSGFNIRGMDGDRVQIVVDGVAQSTPFNPGGGGTQAIYPNMVEIDTLKSIEINKGPSSTLYGSNSLGGTVVLTTKDPEDVLKTDGDEHRFVVKTGYTSDDEQFKNTLTWAMRKGDFETLLIGTYADGHETETFGDGDDIEGDDRGLENPAEKDLNNVLAKAYYRINDAHRIGLLFERYNYKYDENRLSGNYTLSMGPAGSFTYDNAQSHDESTRTRYGINHEYLANNAIFDKLFWQLNYQTSETVNNNTSYVEIVDPFNRFGGNYVGDRSRLRQAKDDNIQFDVQFDKLFDILGSSHELTYGANYKHSDFELNNKDIFHDDPSKNKAGSTTIPDAKVVQWGVYLQDNAFLLNEALVINAGIRYDKFEADPSTDDGFTSEHVKNNNDAFTGKLGAVYHFNKNLSTFAQVSQGFKAPTVEQLYYEYDTGTIFVPNSDLEAEKSTSYEIGFRGQNDHAKFEVTGFINDYKDFIDSQELVSSDPNKDSETLVNRDKVEIRGAEFSSTVLLDGAFGAPTGTYTKLAVSYAEGEDKKTGKRLDSVAPLTTVLGFGYDNLNYNFGGLANVTLVDSKDKWSDEDNVTASGYGILDLTMYYMPVEDLTLRAGLFNAFDRKYWTYNDLRSKDSDDNLDFHSQPGRNWAVTASYEF